MTYLLLQTVLLLLSAYFLGALVACLVKRMLVARGVAMPAAAGFGAPLVRDAPKAVLTPIAPRAYDPIQPKIDVLARPEPRPAPPHVDNSRFDRALTGSVVTRDVPRRPVVEIRPAVLKSPTGPAVKLAPVQQPPSKPQATPVPAPQPQAKAATVTPPPPAPPQPMSTASAAAAAAAAAIAAAKSAVASTSVPSIQSKPAPLPPQQPAAASAPAPEQKRPLAEPPQPVPLAANVRPVQPQPAPKPAATTPVSVPPASQAVTGDDFQRIRAIDADTERRLKNLGVGRYQEIALWTDADTNRVDQALGLSGRIEREQWVEQAQILAKGGETYYSRNRASAGQKPAGAPASSSLAPQQSASSSSSGAAAAAAAAAATIASKPNASAAPSPPSPSPSQYSPVKDAKPAAPHPAAAASSRAAPQRSVSEMATAAAAAIAAASASVTRGIRPIEPISPLSKADPNLSLPAKLQDAIKEQEQKAGSPPRQDMNHLRSVKSESLRTADYDDLKRVRGIGVLIEKRLNSLGVTSYDQIANWTNGDIDRISQTLDFKGRIERENWVEQARILSSGGHTEFSRRVDKGEVETSRDPN